MSERKYDLDAFLGNETIKKLIVHQARSGSIAHAYLLESAAGMGKKTLAKLICSLLACQGQTRPCGTCNVCRKIREDLTPDIMFTSPLPDKKQIGVEQIRALRTEAFLSANELPLKAFLIDQADKMNPQAQNALLKVLEEPPKDVYFFLLAESSTSLLPTVRSRVRQMTLEGLDDEVMTEAIKERIPEARRMAAQDPEGFAELLRRANGSLGRLIELFQSRKKAFDAGGLAIEYLTKLQNERHAVFLAFASGLCKDRGQLNDLCAALCMAVRDMLVRRRVPGATCLLFSDTAACDALAGRYPISVLYALQDCFMTAMEELSANANVQTAQLLMAEHARAAKAR